MSTATPTQRPYYLDDLEQVITETIAPLASEIDQAGAYPRAALEALGKAGLLGLISAKDVGGLGEAHRAATLVIEEVGKYCASSAMVVGMHYAGTAVSDASRRRAPGEPTWHWLKAGDSRGCHGAERSHAWRGGEGLGCDDGHCPAVFPAHERGAKLWHDGDGNDQGGCPREFHEA